MAETLLAGAPWGAAGRGAVTELLAESAMEKRIAALWQRAIGKMLAGRGRCGGVADQGAEAELMAGSAMAKRMAALWQRAIGKMLAGRGAVAELLAGA